MITIKDIIKKLRRNKTIVKVTKKSFFESLYILNPVPEQFRVMKEIEDKAKEMFREDPELAEDAKEVSQQTVLTITTVYYLLREHFRGRDRKLEDVVFVILTFGEDAQEVLNIFRVMSDLHFAAYVEDLRNKQSENGEEK